MVRMHRTPDGGWTEGTSLYREVAGRWCVLPTRKHGRSRGAGVARGAGRTGRHAGTGELRLPLGDLAMRGVEPSRGREPTLALGEASVFASDPRKVARRCPGSNACPRRVRRELRRPSALGAVGGHRGRARKSARGSARWVRVGDRSPQQSVSASTSASLALRGERVWFAARGASTSRVAKGASSSRGVEAPADFGSPSDERKHLVGRLRASARCARQGVNGWPLWSNSGAAPKDREGESALGPARTG
jgi:hypothetical protein